MGAGDFWLPWDSQPQEPVVLRSGLRAIHAAIGDTGYNVATGLPEKIVGEVGRAVTVEGLAFNPTSTAGRRIVCAAPNSTDFTIISRIIPQALPDVAQILTLDNSTGARIFQFRSSGGQASLIRFTTGQVFRSATTSSAALAVGKPVTVIGVASGVDVRVYAGTYSGAATLPGAPSSWDDGLAQPATWFERLTTTSVPISEHGSHLSLLRVVLPYAISDEDAREIATHPAPWQLFFEDRIIEVGGTSEPEPTTKSVTDTATATDAIAISVYAGLTDTGTGADTFDSAAAVPVTDTATGTDAVQATVQLLVTETASGLDQLLLQATVQVADLGSALDAVATLQATLVALADSGTGADAVNAAVQLAVADTGAAVDLVGLQLLLALADSGAGTDALGLQVQLQVADLGTGATALQLMSAVLLTVADAGTGNDQLGPVTVHVPLADSGQGIDALQISALVQLLQQATGVDAVVRFDTTGATRIAIVELKLRHRSVAFAFSQRQVHFSLS